MEGTVVFYLYEPLGPSAFKCGYCKSPDTSMIEGVLGYCMTCSDFQALVDRGFQRSGRFVYRPYMRHTCCPQYVFRVDAAQFRLSKQQRSTIRKMNRFLEVGGPLPGAEGDAVQDGESGSRIQGLVDGHEPEASTTASPLAGASFPSISISGMEAYIKPYGIQPEPKKQSEPKKIKKVVRPGLGPDPSKPPCKKAKVLRMEKKRMKLQQRGGHSEQCETQKEKQEGKHKNKTVVSKPPIQDGPSSTTPLSSATASSTSAPSSSISASTSSTPTPSSVPSSSHHPPVREWLPDKISLPLSPHLNHQLTTRLACCNPRCGTFITTFSESYQVFKKFQMLVHKEPEEDCREQQFNEFLVETPLKKEKAPDGCPFDYGSYHLQYLIDGKIFAVGVLDILPRGVLCEYLYYDPEYRFLAPGVYTALNEISLAQQFYKVNPAMQYYYMGFYVQSCPKMNYKRHYAASELLCTETYTYVDLHKCIPVLKQSPYSRLGDASLPEPEDDQVTDDIIDNLLVLTPPDMRPMVYSAFREKMKKNMDAMMRGYVKLLGVSVARRAKLHLGEPFL